MVVSRVREKCPDRSGTFYPVKKSRGVVPLMGPIKIRDGLSSIRRGLSSIQIPLSRDLDATAASAPFFSTALMYLHLIYVTSLVLCTTNPFFIILPKNQSRQFHLQDFHLRKALQNLH